MAVKEVVAPLALRHRRGRPAPENSIRGHSGESEGAREIFRQLSHDSRPVEAYRRVEEVVGEVIDEKVRDGQ